MRIFDKAIKEWFHNENKEKLKKNVNIGWKMCNEYKIYGII